MQLQIGYKLRKEAEGMLSYYESYWVMKGNPFV
jgi:hypothetical protein